MQIDYAWRGEFENGELNELHAAAFGHRLLDDDWRGQVARHSLGWLTARESSRLVGFVNVPWDGATHAWVIDPIVAPDRRRRGIARRMIEIVVEESRAAGCEWLHVDFDDELRPFYIDACGFAPTNGGLIAL